MFGRGVRPRDPAAGNLRHWVTGNPIECNIIVIPNKKPRFQKEFIWRGQGYDCKWDFISNTKYNSSFIFV